MQSQDTTTVNIGEIEVHSRRAWALTSMAMTYLQQDLNEPSTEVVSEALAEIWERLDAIAAEIHKGDCS